MEINLGPWLTSVDLFILVLTRVAGVFVIAPLFGRRNIPAYFKVGFSFMLALMLMPLLKAPVIPSYQGMWQFVGIAVKEFIVGLAIGYVSFAIFSAVYLAGQIVDIQIGFSMVNVMDPVSNIQVPVTANLYFILSMMMFILADGHHMLINAVRQSFISIPVGGSMFRSELGTEMIRMTSEVFVTGFKIAAPITAVMILTDIALGIISRSVPQLNVFVIGMPLKIFLGIAVMVVTMVMFSDLIAEMLKSTDTGMVNVIRSLMPGK